MRLEKIRIVRILLAIGATACGQEAQQHVASLIPDSAATWRIVEPPTLEIGVEDSPEAYALHQARVPAAYGNVISVANAYREIRLYDTLGSYIRTIGRNGGGPGEFVRLWAFRPLSGGRFITLDLEGAKVQVLDSLGTSDQPTVLAGGFEANAPIPFLPDGRAVGLGRSWPTYAEGTGAVMRRDTVPINVFDRNTGEPVEIGRIPGHMWWISAGNRTGVPLGPRVSLAANGDLVAASDGNAYRFSVFDLSTNRSTIIELDQRPPAVDESIIAAWEEERRAESRALGRPDPVLYPPGFDFTPPETLPGYARLLIDDVDCAWAQRYPVPGSGYVEWDVFDPRIPALIARMTIPRSFVLSQATANTLLGISTDQFGIQRIRRYLLEAPAGDRAC